MGWCTLLRNIWKLLDINLCVRYRSFMCPTHLVCTAPSSGFSLGLCGSVCSRAETLTEAKCVGKASSALNVFSGQSFTSLDVIILLRNISFLLSCCEAELCCLAQLQALSRGRPWSCAYSSLGAATGGSVRARAEFASHILFLPNMPAWGSHLTVS